MKRSRWPLVHQIIAGVAAVAFFILLAIPSTQASIMTFLNGRRISFYPVLIGLSGTLLGFSLASLTFAVGYGQSEKLIVVREAGQLKNLFQVFSAALRSFALLVLLSFTALTFDTDLRPNRLALALVVGAVVLGALRLVRLLMVFHAFIEVVLEDRHREPGALRATRR